MTVSPQSPPTPFVEFGREAWSRLAATTPLPLTSDDVALLRGLGDPTDLTEVDDVYRPLSALLQLYAGATGALHEATSSFLGERPRRTPYVIGIAGSVAVGKSSTARLMRELMRRWPQTPRVDLVTTDGFLYPNAELERRGLLQRKGFPESYDRRALLRFVAEVKGGAAEVSAPLYDHVTYDIVPERRQVVRRPDVLIVEGLNVLQPARITADGTTSIAVSDFFDFSIYVDARRRDIKRWYVDRFLKLRSTAFSEPGSYFRHFAELDDAAAVTRAEQIWTSINERNLRENIEPTRGRATLVVTKDAEHRVHRMRLRKL
ncbi:pantothenate kinase [Bogoriella caseilytica]|uniref:Pantothenate kinase n=1 Tax=Bogoriella caseilytica TaxID=56055 RepID=A0A3N2BEA5_9MICO|nr:pantothenate kinase [Bogoriella caseilytica]